MHKVYSYSDLLFFFNDTASTEIYTLSLHDALPILELGIAKKGRPRTLLLHLRGFTLGLQSLPAHVAVAAGRSEEHTSELQSRQYIVCRLLLEKKHKCPSVIRSTILLITLNSSAAAS